MAASIPIGITLIAPARSFPRICKKTNQCKIQIWETNRKRNWNWIFTTNVPFQKNSNLQIIIHYSWISIMLLLFLSENGRILKGSAVIKELHDRSQSCLKCCRWSVHGCTFQRCWSIVWLCGLGVAADRGWLQSSVSLRVDASVSNPQSSAQLIPAHPTFPTCTSTLP